MGALSKPLNFYSEDSCLSNIILSSLVDKTEVFLLWIRAWCDKMFQKFLLLTTLNEVKFLYAP